MGKLRSRYRGRRDAAAARAVSTDPFSLHGKTILVTGASSGIGRGVAVGCAEQGATLIVSGRNEERLNATLASLAGSGHRAIAADLTDFEQLRRLADECGPIDGLFFSAGIAAIAPFRMISEKHVRHVMSIDFDAPVMLAQRLLQRRQVRAGGSIVFNTAMAVKNSPAGSAIYSAAKAALTAASRSLALEVAKDRIRVTCLECGYVQTEMLEQLKQSGMDPFELASHTPLGIGSVEDAANAAMFLLSDASRWVSRTALTADGGLSLRISH
jgi:NAD(P)-dependent dehydrogenase (short-subunit alcohol dehydrogenase family)